MSSWKITLGLVVVVIAYIVLGGIGFHFIESNKEKAIRADLSDVLKSFLENNTCVNQTAFTELLQKVIQAYRDGVVSIGNQTSPPNWDYHSSIFFATTIVSTIGYGNISPKTTGGRTFAVVFALIGIPLFLTMLALIGALQSRLFDWLILGRVFQQHRHDKSDAQTSKAPAAADASADAASPGDDEPEVCGSGTDGGRPFWLRHRRLIYHIVRVLVNLVFCMAFFCFVPAAIFYAIEGWSYGVSLYYACITIMTIGFGDYVAGASTDVSYRGWYRLCVAVWIGLGLASCAGFINTIQDAYLSLVEVVEKRAADKMAARTVAEKAAAADAVDSASKRSIDDGDDSYRKLYNEETANKPWKFTMEADQTETITQM